MHPDAWPTHPTFEDLRLTGNRGEDDGIGKELDIQVEGTFKFSIKDNKGKVYTINIPKSLYLPKLRQCLLLPQHWVQEAGDRQTWMENFEHECVMNQKGEKKTIPFNATTNTPLFFTAPSSCAHCAFTLILKPLKHHTSTWRLSSNFLGVGTLSVSLPFFPEEFVAEENVNFCKDVSVN
jgi:hypothetical protein